MDTRWSQQQESAIRESVQTPLRYGWAPSTCVYTFADMAAALATLDAERAATARLRAVVEAAERWARTHGDHDGNVWDADKNLPLAGACEDGVCGVRHDCPNEFDASEDHLIAALYALPAAATPAAPEPA